MARLNVWRRSSRGQRSGTAVFSASINRDHVMLVVTSGDQGRFMNSYEIALDDWRKWIAELEAAAAKTSGQKATMNYDFNHRATPNTSVA